MRPPDLLTDTSIEKLWVGEPTFRRTLKRMGFLALPEAFMMTLPLLFTLFLSVMTFAPTSRLLT